ncbi:MAG: transposase family protein [Armatimonadetes bacterium]|nr:transposase family protein [Armatimonadota bacterium]
MLVQEAPVSPTSKREYVQAVRQRYERATRVTKVQILTEVCATTGYHRKAAIRALTQPPRPATARRRGRPSPYDPRLLSVLEHIWEAAGYPWSVRLKALLPLWLPWARQHLDIPARVEHHLQTISPSTIDRYLRQTKHRLRRRLYGRTKPGALLKHHIPVKTEHWDIAAPGFTEVDLVSHSGDCADGDFIQSLNLTDIYSGWGETRAVMGKGQVAVGAAVDEIRDALPFPLRGLDSDNGSEFINHHLFRYCEAREIQFTRGRPYKKDDNAHIEQKNWTHVRRLLGWDRYDSPQALAAINDLYRGELRLATPPGLRPPQDPAGPPPRRRGRRSRDPPDPPAAPRSPRPLHSRRNDRAEAPPHLWPGAPGPRPGHPASTPAPTVPNPTPAPPDHPGRCTGPVTRLMTRRYPAR